MSEALLVEDFKSYKTLKQESIPQETSKEILAKNIEKMQSTKIHRARSSNNLI